MQNILLDEFHVSIYVKPQVKAVNHRVAKTLDRRSFQADLRRAIQSVFDRHQLLKHVVVKITR